MTPPAIVDRVLLVLSPSPVRTMMGEWLATAGFQVRTAPVWEVDPLVESGEAGVVVTSDDLDGEWGWSDRHGRDVLVLSLPEPSSN